MSEAPPSPFLADLRAGQARFMSGQVVAVDGAGGVDLLKIEPSSMGS